MKNVKILVKGETKEITIDNMICKDCELRYNLQNAPATNVLNCKKFPAGKPYQVLKTNRCEEYK